MKYMIKKITVTEYFLYVSVYVSQIDIHALLDDLHTYGAIINSFGKELEDHAMTKRKEKGQTTIYKHNTEN